MKRIVFWALGTVAALGAMFSANTSTAGPFAAAPTGAPQSSFSAGSTAGMPQTGAGQSTDSGSTNAPGNGSGGNGSGGNAGGNGSGSNSSSPTTYTGDVATNEWGPVQVEIAVADGAITGVNVLQSPTGGRSDQINAQALPILTQETMDAQSANIDMVSGATLTSQSYLTSLQSALDQAGL